MKFEIFEKALTWSIEKPSPVLSEGPDLDLMEAIQTRNVARADAGLPLLDIEEELAKARLVKAHRAFATFAEPIRERVTSKVIEIHRRRIGAPNWTPGGPLNGGYMVQIRSNEILHRLYSFHRRRTADGKP